MALLFIPFTFLDFLDILLVAVLLYQFYNLIKGSAAVNIFIGIFSIYMVWLLVKALNMQLLSSILGQVIGVGIIALIIVFQQEIRRFLLLMGTRYMSKRFGLENLFTVGDKPQPKVRIKSIMRACISLSRNKTGGLMVIGRNSALELYAETGDIINANTSSRLIETIFYKGSPMHDGAIIIIGDKIFASRCILPVSQNLELPAQFGMRHRAALGMSESNDSLVIIISEETGNISFAEYGKITSRISIKELSDKLESEFSGVNPTL